jgi:hypothetical protein
VQGFALVELAGDLAPIVGVGNATDLPITEHATDTHGVTLVNLGLFDLLGMQLSPRIRDLGRITLYRPGLRGDAVSRFPHAGPLMTRTANLELIAKRWDDLLRAAGRRYPGIVCAADEFAVFLCAYWPKQTILDGTWKPPAVILRI